jgi:hypothetical protein
MRISFRVEGELREHLDELLLHIKTHDLDEVDLSVDSIDADVFKLSMTTNIDYAKIHKILKGIKHSLCHFVTPRIRTKRLYEQVKDLIGELSSEEKKDFKTIMMEVCKAIEDDYDAVCTTGDINYYNKLCEDFVVFHEFSSEITKSGPLIYNKYVQMMKDVGTCRALLPRLAPQKIVKEGKPWTVRKDTIDAISGQFSHLFSAVNDFRTAFDKPPSDEKGNGGDQTDLGIDDEQAEVKRADAVHYIVTLGWTLPQTARHMNMTVEELVDLLGLGVGG